MATINNCVEGCSLPSSPNDIKILLKQILREVKELSERTEAKLLCHDGKIAEMCKYIKDNLSNTLRCMLDSMKLSGELDNLIIDVVNNEIDLLKSLFATPEDYGAIGNGLNDDTLAIKNVINSGNKRIFLIKEYLVTSEIIIDSKKDLSIIGPGTIIYNNPNTNNDTSLFKITNCENLVIDNVSIYSKEFESGNGCWLENSKNVSIKNCNIRNFKDCGIYVPDNDNVVDLTVLNCNITKCRFGIVAYSNGMKISKCYINNEWFLSEEYKNNGKWNESYPYYDGIIITGSNFEITENTITGNGQSGIYSGSCSKGVIANNNIYENQNIGIDMGIVVDYTEETAIKNLNVIGNNVYGNLSHQINMTGVKNSCISGNNVETSKGSFGIILTRKSNNNIFIGNFIQDDYNGRGISFENTTYDNMVIYNKIISATPYNLAGSNQFVDLEEINSKIIIDLQNKTGEDGRLAFDVKASDDNVWINFRVNKQIQFRLTDGSNAPVTTGALTFGGNGEISNGLGIINFQNAERLTVPKQGTGVKGTIYFDETTSTFKGFNGHEWVTLG